MNQFNDVALVANSDQLEKVTKFKYLRGVSINQSLYLTWQDHIDQLQRKLN